MNDNDLDKKIEKLIASQDTLSRQRQKQTDAEIAHGEYKQLSVSAENYRNNNDSPNSEYWQLVARADTAKAIYLKIINQKQT